MQRFLLQMFKKFSHSTTIFYLLSFLILGGMLAFAHPVFAQATQLETLGAASGLPQENIVIIIARVIRAILGILGIVTVLLVVYAGFLYMTAAGDDTKVKKAKAILQQTVIGLIIIFSSYSIATFILNKLLSAATSQSSISSQAALKYNEPLAGSLGAGILESHYPVRDATKIPRNTKIFVTFKEAIKPSTLIEGYDKDPNSTKLNTNGVKIFETAKGNKNPLKNTDVIVTFDQQKKTFVFRPVSYLGNETKDTNYTVFLSPEIQKDSGGPAFTNEFKEGYQWVFEVSTELDLTPPKIVSVLPVKDSKNPRNTTVQITFNEVMDPGSSAGVYDSKSKIPLFQNILVKNGNEVINGTYTIGNSFKTVDFTTMDACAKDPCGNIIYCLPGGKDLNVLVKAASLDPKNIPQAILIGSQYDGLTDAAGNSLDGNGDGFACGSVTDGVVCKGGSPDDSYTFGFSTTSEVDATIPKIVSLEPNINQGDIDPTGSIYALFNTYLKASTINSSSVSLWPDPQDYSMWFSVQSGEQSDFGLTNTPGVSFVVSISHPSFISKAEDGHKYNPVLTQEIRSINQICLFPAAGPIANPPEKSCLGTDASKPHCCNGIAQSEECKNSQGLVLPLKP